MFRTSLQTLRPRLSLLRTFTLTSTQFNKVSITLYAKEGCSLCDKAKDVLIDVLVDERIPIEKELSFTNVDILDPLNKQWWDKYCFDVPVVHIDRWNQKDPVKFMHRLNPDELVEEINRVVE